MKGSLTLFKIKDIEIQLHISWIIIFTLISFSMATGYLPMNYPEVQPYIYWLFGGGIALLMLVSVLLHELSHSIVSKSLGVEVKTITLFIFGGIAQMDEEPDTPIKELKIAIAGPLMSIFLFVIFSVLAYLVNFINSSAILIGSIRYVSTINLVLAVFNMVPAFPMDGGRVLRSIIWKVKDDLTFATKIASSMGDMFGYFLIFLGLYWAFTGNIADGIWFVFIGWFIKNLSESSYQNMLMSDMFNKIHIREFMTKDVVSIERSISVEKVIKEYFYKYKYNSFPVVQGEEVKGIINVQRLKDVDRERRAQTPVGEIALPIEDKYTVDPKCKVKTAMDKIFSNDLGRVLVIEDEKLLGIISRTDILNYIRVYGKLQE
ncbi:MAG: site-2 protease family protein [Bacillota bacterium]|nr:site-2 protease family protein [Bacillota bacterium]